MLATLLSAMILTGLGGLVAPSDPKTTWGRMGVWIRRIAFGVIVLGVAIGFFYRDELLAGLS